MVNYQRRYNRLYRRSNTAKCLDYDSPYPQTPKKERDPGQQSNRRKKTLMFKNQSLNNICYQLKIKNIVLFKYRMFVERQVPELNHICTFTDSNKTTNIDFCPHLICLAESAQNLKNSFVIFPGKIGHINIIVLEQACIIGKHTIEIPYSYSCKITSLVTEVVNESKMKIKTKQNKLSRGIYIFIGFEDGTLAMYLLLQTGVARPMVQIFKMKPKLKKKQPVINFKIIRTHLIVVCAYTAFLFKNIFDKQAENGITNAKLSEQQIKIKINSCKIDIEVDENNSCMYFYNEFEGATCLSMENFSEIKVIQDSLKLVKVCSKLIPKQENIAAFGSTDDALKFINYKSNKVTKFIGFKNYATCFEQDIKNGLLWVSSLDGSVACFQYLPKKQQKIGEFCMQVSKLKYRQQISQNGIKKIIVHNNILVVFDTNHNIQFYDINIQAFVTQSDYTSSSQN